MIKLKELQKIDIKQALKITMRVSICITLSIITTYIIDYTYIWVHEMGHVMFSLIISTLTGQIMIPYVTRWGPHIFPYMIVPIETKVIQHQLTLMGAMITVMTITTIISIDIKYKLNNKKALILIPIFLYRELINSICGTDNLTGSPLIYCSESMNIIMFYPYYIMLIATITYLLYLTIYKNAETQAVTTS